MAINTKRHKAHAIVFGINKKKINVILSTVKTPHNENTQTQVHEYIQLFRVSATPPRITVAV